jgi:flagellar capping protein FliD
LSAYASYFRIARPTPDPVKSPSQKSVKELCAKRKQTKLKKPDFEILIKENKCSDYSKLTKLIDKTTSKLEKEIREKINQMPPVKSFDDLARIGRELPRLVLNADFIACYNVLEEEMPSITDALKGYVEKIVTPCSDGKHDWLPLPMPLPMSVLPGRGFVLYCTICECRRVMLWTSAGFIKYVFKPYKDNPSRLPEEMRNYLESLMNQQGRGILSDAVSEIDKKIKRLAKKYPKTESRIKKLEELKNFCYIQANLYL